MVLSGQARMLRLLALISSPPPAFYLKSEGSLSPILPGEEYRFNSNRQRLSPVQVRTEARTPARRRARWTVTVATPSPPDTTFNPHPHCPSRPIFKLRVPTPPSYEQRLTKSCDEREPTVGTFPLAAGGWALATHRKYMHEEG